MFKRLLAAMVVLLVVVTPVLASDITSISGRASYKKHLSLTVHLDAPTTLTVTASFTPTKSVVVLYLNGPAGCGQTLDQRWGRNPGVATLTCSIDAPAGEYSAEMWTFSGWTDATITLSAP